MDWHKELIFAPNEPKDVAFLRKLIEKGRVKKVAPKVYTTNLVDSTEDYLLALRKLSRNGLPDTYVSVMERLHRFSSAITCSSYKAARQFLERTNAFSDADDAHLIF